MSDQQPDSSCLPFIRKMAGYLKWRFRLPQELDELISCGFLGYCEAMERFDPSVGVRPEVYAYHRVRGAILDAACRRTVLSKWMYKRARLGGVDRLADCSAAAKMEAGVLRTQVEKLIDDLPPQQRDIVRCRHFDELTFDEIGEIFGFQKSWACRIHKKALLSLHAALSGEQAAVSVRE